MAKLKSSPRAEVGLDDPSSFEHLLQNASANLGSAATPGAADSLHIATVVNAESADRVLVAISGSESPIPARTMARVAPEDVGRHVVVGFELGCLDRPIVLGFLAGSPCPESDEALKLKGDRLSVEGRQEVVIRCGSASITLTESGKVLIKGDYVSSRASGTNRLRGGSVQIN